MKAEIIQIWETIYIKEAYIKVNKINKVIIAPISDETYQQLKNLGVPTEQSRRKK